MNAAVQVEDDPGRLALARALGFGCVYSMEHPNAFAQLAEHSRAYAEAVTHHDEAAARASFAVLDAPQTDLNPALTLARQYAAPLFVEGVRLALANPASDPPAPIAELDRFTCAHFAALGFRCPLDAFQAIAPHAERLTLQAYSEEQRRYRGFDVIVTTAPFWTAGVPIVHFTFESPDHSPLPFTETGYWSHFAYFAELAQYASLDAYLETFFPPDAAERAGQQSLF